MDGIWVEHHKWHSRRYDARTFIRLPMEAFLELREIYAEELAVRAERGPEGWLGFVPATMARMILTEAGYDLRDLELELQYFLYQQVRVARGTWEEGPTERWRVFPALIEEARGW